MSTVCGFGVFASQLGLALGFVLTPFFIGNHEHNNDIPHNLQKFHIGMAAVTTIITLFVISCKLDKLKK